MANPTYTVSRYTFTSPNEDRKYIKTLAVIAAYNAKGVLPDRALVEAKLDPTRFTAQGPRGKQRSNWGNSRWTAMKQAGLITRLSAGYAVTPKGIELLAQARDNSCWEAILLPFDII